MAVSVRQVARWYDSEMAVAMLLRTNVGIGNVCVRTMQRGGGTHRAEGERGQDPLQLALGDVQVFADRGQRDRHRRRVRSLPMRMGEAQA